MYNTIIFNTDYNHFNKPFKKGSKWDLSFSMLGYRLDRIPKGKPRWLSKEELHFLADQEIVSPCIKNK